MQDREVQLLVENTRLTAAFELLREIVLKETKKDSSYAALEDLDMVLTVAGIKIPGELEIM